jgi:predicted ArsR family transcriptional regulator
VSEQLELGANALGPFQRHSQTSRSAALDNFPRSGSQRKLVLLYLLDHPATREEVGHALRLGGSSVRPRVAELVEGGWVEDYRIAGELVTRRTASGSQAIVLRATPKARAALT